MPSNIIIKKREKKRFEDERQRQNAKVINYVVECECCRCVCSQFRTSSCFSDSNFFGIFLVLWWLSGCRRVYGVVPQVHSFPPASSYTWRCVFLSILFFGSLFSAHSRTKRWCCNLPNYPLNIFQNVLINHEWKIKDEFSPKRVSVFAARSRFDGKGERKMQIIAFSRDICATEAIKIEHFRLRGWAGRNWYASASSNCHKNPQFQLSAQTAHDGRKAWAASTHYYHVKLNLEMWSKNVWHVVSTMIIAPWLHCTPQSTINEGKLMFLFSEFSFLMHMQFIKIYIVFLVIASPIRYFLMSDTSVGRVREAHKKNC